MKEKINTLRKKGFFSIYISTILSKVVTLLGGIIIVRILSPEDYSIYTLVINAISILCFFGDFGSSSATLQYSIESKNDKNKRKAFHIFGLKVGLSASILSSILILTSRLFYPYKSVTVANYAMMLFIIPILTTIIGFFSIYLRAHEENKKYSLYQFVSVLIHYGVIILFTFIFGLIGSLISQYIYNLIILVVGVLFVGKLIFKNKEKTDLEEKEKKDFIKLSFGSQINNTITHLLYTVDIFILGIFIINNVEVSYYKVATIIPNALAFLPNCLMIFLMPYFVKNNKNKKWIKTNINKLLLYSSAVYGLITLGLVLLSEFIITILYGTEYLSSVPIFNILIIGFFFSSTFKVPLANLLYAMHKIKINLIISVTGLVLNLILNLIFVNIFGYIGAAYATVIVTFIMSLLNVLYLIKTLKEMEDV